MTCSTRWTLALGTAQWLAIAVVLGSCAAVGAMLGWARVAWEGDR